MSRLMHSHYILLVVSLLFLAGCPTSSSISILSPPDGASFQPGQEITFSGIAVDLEGVELSGDSLIWTSSVNGEIGRGKEFKRSDLVEATHEITLIATDASGVPHTATITITIGSTTTTVSLTDIKGEFEILKYINVQGEGMNINWSGSMRIPFQVEDTTIVVDESLMSTQVVGGGTFGDCTVEIIGYMQIRNLGGELTSSDLGEYYLNFTFEVNETEYWTWICPEGTDNDEWTAEWWKNSVSLSLIDQYTTLQEGEEEFRYTLHLE